MRSLGRLLLWAIALACPAASHASWLGLADGLYDVTLSCVYSSVPCPPGFHASLTISGSGASAMSASINNQVFSGDPTDVSGGTGPSSFESVVLDDTPFSSFGIVYDLVGPTLPGLSDHWWGYCSNLGVNECTPAAAGDWVATAVSPAPEPSTAALFALGLAGMAALLRRRVRG